MHSWVATTHRYISLEESCTPDMDSGHTYEVVLGLLQLCQNATRVAVQLGKLQSAIVPQWTDRVDMVCMNLEKIFA